MTMGDGAVRVRVLVDNRADLGLIPEHGFSAWIEAAGLRVLFDTGQGPALVHNASQLSVAVDTADVLVLSHGHYDHSGGLPWVVERAAGVQVYCHPRASSERFAVRNGEAKSIGMPDSARLTIGTLSGARLHWVTAPIELAPGLGLSGPIPRATAYEDVGGPFFCDAEGTRCDPIDDDLALWVRTEAGLVVLVGCSHAGLINSLEHALRVSGSSRLHAVIGGFHLREASGERLERTVSALRALGAALVVPCHCTGERVMERLQKSFPKSVVLGAAGAVYGFGAAVGARTGWANAQS